MDGGAHAIYHLESATYANSFWTEPCTTENWWDTWNNENTWVECPAGNALRGLYRSPGDDAKLWYIEEGLCCPGVAECVETDIAASFDHEGLSSCPTGYAISGMYRGGCGELHCMEKIKCCRIISDMPSVSPTEAGGLIDVTASEVMPNGRVFLDFRYSYVVSDFEIAMNTNIYSYSEEAPNDWNADQDMCFGFINREFTYNQLQQSVDFTVESGDVYFAVDSSFEYNYETNNYRWSYP